MKTIQIPTNSNPFIVSINNHVYQYRAGETIEVPDEVAEAIEDALELAPKPGIKATYLGQFVEGRITEIKGGDLGGIKSIAPFAFYNNDSLIRVEIPQGVTSINEAAFAYCNKLANVTMPDSITNIDVRVFANSVNLKRVVVKAVTPPIAQTESFVSIPSACVFEVPSAAVEAYKAAKNWSSLASQIIAIKE